MSLKELSNTAVPCSLTWGDLSEKEQEQLVRINQNRENLRKQLNAENISLRQMRAVLNEGKTLIKPRGGDII